MPPPKISLADKLASFDETWVPKVAAELMDDMGGFSDDAINDILEAAGFSSGAIKDAMSDVFGGDWADSLKFW